MKNLHGVRSLLVTSVMALAVGLTACAKSEVGTPNQHKQGDCGLRPTSALLKLQNTCENIVSLESAEACQKDADRILKVYSGINCRIVYGDYEPTVVTEKTVRGFRERGQNYSSKTGCTAAVEKDFNKILGLCSDASPATRAECAAATSEFKVNHAAGLQCAGAKSTFGKPVAINQAAVQSLRERAGVEFDSGGACGAQIEVAFLKTSVACSEISSSDAALRCRTSADHLLRDYVGINCVLTEGTVVTTVNASKITELRAKASQFPAPQ